jgi:FtsP/CotA-like multicopper oxidase with cupredoxin domain
MAEPSACSVDTTLLEGLRTFFYHSHTEVDRQQALGLYGALLIQPKDPAQRPRVDQELLVQLQEWNEREGYTFPAMPMEGTLPNFFTINGKDLRSPRQG